MPRRRRYIRSNAPYEICLRAKAGFPFPAWLLMLLLLSSALARTQRDLKVVVCHYIWLNNHLHLILIARDPAQCAKFIMELKKKITDYVKRLTGKNFLNLWEDGSMIAEILDEECVQRRIAYFYTNAGRADLVDSISEYPGLSTWSQFSNARTVDSKFTEPIPWVRLPAVHMLPSQALTERQDSFIVNKLRKSSTLKHDLTVEPNAWMKCFGIDDSEVDEINENIRARVHDEEKEFRAERARTGKTVIGASKLKRRGITWDHVPKKRERRIFVLSSLNELRMQYIDFISELCEHCRELYGMACAGARVDWPPGIFAPRIPPLCSLVGQFES